MSDSWTAIDFETANADRGSACSVGLVRVRDGVVVDRYSTLVRPPAQADFFSRHNIAVHGITPDDVADAPRWERVYADIVEFAEDDPLVAHNAAFDIGVLNQACRYAGLARSARDYACTLALSRRTWADLSDHRLPTVCAHIGHELAGHHRADVDAEAAARIAIAAMERHGTASLADLSRLSGAGLRRLEEASPGPVPVAAAAPRQGGDRFARWQRAAQAPLPEPAADADPSGPLYGRVVCVSGDLETMDKPEAWRRVAEAGGIAAKNVTRKTDVLVVGGHDGPGKTSKHLQAEAYAARGQRIDFVTEADLLVMLGMTF
ncbi:exonuclease domain-containing protein [Nocardiopsis algeriensis]|uniref:DNA polymerase-3 subunit epsilon n=1 Tax=Nocardiopsis algeriensis TaxID=1478215 RepID=A0A841IUR4_9ACTN|nr:DNA polymerase-3 subunit epsilon [Nocardiopsis algeriensis]